MPLSPDQIIALSGLAGFVAAALIWAAGNVIAVRGRSVMTRSRSFKTSVLLSLDHGSEHEMSLTLVYNFTPGQPNSWEEPGYGDSVEIEKVRLWQGVTELTVPSWVENFVDCDKELRESLIADAREADESDRADAAERRADEARDLRMLEGAPR